VHPIGHDLWNVPAAPVRAESGARIRGDDPTPDSAVGSPEHIRSLANTHARRGTSFRGRHAGLSIDWSGTGRRPLGPAAVRCLVATVEIVVRPTSAGRITNTALVTASASDPIPANNADSEDTRVCRHTSTRPSSIPGR
jgi:hypothetical protein